jgi:hypothetical protein
LKCIECGIDCGNSLRHTNQARCVSALKSQINQLRPGLERKEALLEDKNNIIIQQRVNNASIIALISEIAFLTGEFILDLKSKNVQLESIPIFSELNNLLADVAEGLGPDRKFDLLVELGKKIHTNNNPT